MPDAAAWLAPSVRRRFILLLGGSCLLDRILARVTLSNSGKRHNLPAMTKPTQAVLARALQLDTEERAALAAELLASLDGPADPDAEAAWAAEIRRRVAAIESGAAHLEPWDAVRGRIEKEILGR